jgi:hypothetical protein
MAKVLGTFKHTSLDLVAMGKGFAYGFIMFGLFIAIAGAFLYGILFLKNVVF